MKKFILIIVSFLALSCNKVFDKPVDLDEISFEWIGDSDKPLYKLILCVDCVSEKDFLMRKIKISEASMKEIKMIGFDNNQLKINKDNKQDVVQKLMQIDKILDSDSCSEEDRDDVKIFIKRIP